MAILDPMFDLAQTVGYPVTDRDEFTDWDRTLVSLTVDQRKPVTIGFDCHPMQEIVDNATGETHVFDEFGTYMFTMP